MTEYEQKEVCSLVPEHRFWYEQEFYTRGFSSIAGLDEAGRGPLAGPVVAACVVLPKGEDWLSFDAYKDSKKLTPKKRLTAYDRLLATAAIGVGIVSEREIERINILQASLLAMQIAVQECRSKGTPCDVLLIDGRHVLPLEQHQVPLIKGEDKSCSIAAASIIAKVTRDRLMAEYHEQYPQYNFIKNQGYPTAEHRLALQVHGASPCHRRTFKGVKELLI